MASARSSRGSTTIEGISHLSARERLLVAQAVYEYGADAWPDISKVLSKHPLIDRPNGFFSPQACQMIYLHLMGEAGYECSDETHAPHARLNLKLAQRHYQARVVELRSLILAEEDKFKTIASEIEDIRSGRWDNKIAQELGISVENGDRAKTVPHEKVHSPPTDSLTPTESSVVLETSQAGNTDMFTGDSITLMYDQDTELKRESQPTLTTSEQDKVDVPLSQSLSGPGRPPTPTSPQVAQSTPEKENIVETVEPNGLPKIIPEEPLESSTNIASLANKGDDLRMESGVLIEDNQLRRIDSSEEKLDSTQTLAQTLQNRPRVSHEGRTLEEIKAIEALEELSRQKAVDFVSPPEAMTQHSSSSILQPLSASLPDLPIISHRENYANEDVKTSLTLNTSLPSSSISQGKRKASDAEALTPDSSRDKKKARDDSVPMEDDDLGRRRSRPSLDTSTSKKFQAVMTMLHSQISQHRNGNLFHNPIKDSEAPDYHEIVRRPMDLKTMKMKIRDGLISNSDDYQRDLYLMFANAMMYNRPKSDIYRMAQEMMVESEGHVRDFRQTEDFFSRGKR